MTIPTYHNGAGSSPGLGAATSATFTLSTDVLYVGSTILVAASFSSAGGSTPSVTGITGKGMTFQRIYGPTQFANVPVTSGGTGTVSFELWVAYNAPSWFLGGTFTATFSSAVQFPNSGCILGAICFGQLANPASPWDTASAFPAIVTGIAPQALTWASSVGSIDFNRGDPSPIRTAIVGGGVLGPGGDELLFTMVLAAGPHNLDTIPAGLPGSQWGAQGLTGTGGNWSAPDFSLDAYFQGFTAPVATAVASVAELWFAQTAGFVDLSVTANRRKFISDKAGACNLGTNGATPFGATPSVYLTVRGDPSTFATNNGNGGAFTLDGTIDTATTAPLSVTTSAATTSGGGALVLGVVGDYRNGNLYHFSPAALTDNGTARRWVRRWRALPGGTNTAARYGTLVIDMQTGAVPDGVNAQLMLRWSDDGGHTWSDGRILSIGGRGQTAVSVKFNRLGSGRRWRGNDRIFELSSADPFKVAIIGADLELS